MCTFAKRREDAMAITNPFPSIVSDRLAMSLVTAIDMQRRWCGDGKYRILVKDKSYTLDFIKKICNCG